MGFDKYYKLEVYPSGHDPSDMTPFSKNTILEVSLPTGAGSYTQTYEVDVTPDTDYSRVLEAERTHEVDITPSTDLSFGAVTNGREYIVDVTPDTDLTRVLSTTRSYESAVTPDTDYTSYYSTTRTYEVDVTPDSDLTNGSVTAARIYEVSLDPDSDYTKGTEAYVREYEVSLDADTDYSNTASLTQEYTNSLDVDSNLTNGNPAYVRLYESDLDVATDYTKGIEAYVREYAVSLTPDTDYTRILSTTRVHEVSLDVDTDYSYTEGQAVDWLKQLDTELILSDDISVPNNMIIYNDEPYFFYLKNFNLYGKRLHNGSWENLNGGDTLNYNASYVATRAIKLCVMGSDLYVAWTEFDENGSGGLDDEYFIRVKKFNGTTWSTADNSTYAVYMEGGHHLTTEKLLVYDSSLYLFYSYRISEDFTINKYRIGGVKFNGTTWSAIDGGSTLCYHDYSADTSGDFGQSPSFFVYDDKILAFLPEIAEDDSDRINMYVKSYNGSSWSNEYSGNPLFGETYYDAKYVKGTTEFNNKLYISMFMQKTDNTLVYCEFLTFDGSTWAFNTPDLIEGAVWGWPTVYNNTLYLVAWDYTIAGDDSLQRYNNDTKWYKSSYLDNLSYAYGNPDEYCIDSDGNYHWFWLQAGGGENTDVYHTVIGFDIAVVPKFRVSAELAPDTDVSLLFIQGRQFASNLDVDSDYVKGAETHIYSRTYEVSLEVDSNYENAGAFIRTYESSLDADSSLSQVKGDITITTPILVADGTSAYSLEYNSNNLVRGLDGALYVVAEYQSTYNQIACFKSLDNGHTWSSMSFPDQGNYVQKAPSIAIDSNGYLHVVWYGKSSSYSSYYNIRYAKYTGSWSSVTNLTTDTAKEQITPTIAIGTDDYIHVTWAGGITGYSFNQIRYMKYISSWSSITDLSTANLPQYRPNIAIATDVNKPYIVWYGWTAANDEPNIQERHYLTSSWSTLRKITDTSAYNQYPHICMVDSDNYTIAWSYSTDGTDNGYIKIIRCVDGTEESLEQIPSYTNYAQNHVSIAYDDSNNPHLIWKGRKYGEGEASTYGLAHSEFNGSTWSTEERWTTTEDEYPSAIQGFTNFTEVPCVWVTDGNIYFRGVFAGTERFTQTYENELTPDSDYTLGTIGLSLTFENSLAVDTDYTRLLDATRTYDNDLAVDSSGIFTPHPVYENDLALDTDVGLVLYNARVYENNLDPDTDLGLRYGNKLFFESDLALSTYLDTKKYSSMLNQLIASGSVFGTGYYLQDATSQNIIRDHLGNLYVVATKIDSDMGQYGLACFKSSDNGDTWTDLNMPVDMSGSVEIRHPSIAVDSKNDIHIAWSVEGSTGDIKYITYNGYDWSDIATIVAGSGDIIEIYPSMVIDSNDHIHLAWIRTQTSDGTDGLRYSKYTTSWSTPINLVSNVSIASVNINLAVADKPHIVYCLEDSVKHISYDGSAWSSVETVATDDYVAKSTITMQDNTNYAITWISRTFSDVQKIKVMRCVNGSNETIETIYTGSAIDDDVRGLTIAYDELGHIYCTFGLIKSDPSSEDTYYSKFINSWSSPASTGFNESALNPVSCANYNKFLKPLTVYEANGSIYFNGVFSMEEVRSESEYVNDLAVDTDYTKTSHFIRTYENSLAVDTQYGQKDSMEFIDSLDVDTDYIRTFTASRSFESDTTLDTDYSRSATLPRTYDTDLTPDTDLTREGLTATREFANDLDVDSSFSIVVRAVRTYTSSLAVDTEYSKVIALSQTFDNPLPLDTDYSKIIALSQTFDNDLAVDSSYDRTATHPRDYINDLALDTDYERSYLISSPREYENGLDVDTDLTMGSRLLFNATSSLAVDSSYDRGDMTASSREYDTELTPDSSYLREFSTYRIIVTDLTVESDYTRGGIAGDRTFSSDVIPDMSYNRSVEYMREYDNELDVDTYFDIGRIRYTNELDVDSSYTHSRLNATRAFTNEISLDMRFASGIRVRITTTLGPDPKPTTTLETQKVGSSIDGYTRPKTTITI